MTLFYNAIQLNNHDYQTNQQGTKPTDQLNHTDNPTLEPDPSWYWKVRTGHMEQQENPMFFFDPSVPLPTRVTLLTDSSALYASELRTFLLTLL